MLLDKFEHIYACSNIVFDKLAHFMQNKRGVWQTSTYPCITNIVFDTTWYRLMHEHSWCLTKRQADACSNIVFDNIVHIQE